MFNSLDSINVELAERVNELTYEQIGQSCLWLSQMLEVCNSFFSNDSMDKDIISTYEETLMMKLFLVELASEGII